MESPEWVREINKEIMIRLTSKPMLRLLDLDSITDEEIKGYLMSKHSVTWARMFTVTSEDTLAEAVAFFRKEVEGIYSFLARVRREEGILVG